MSFVIKLCVKKIICQSVPIRNQCFYSTCVKYLSPVKDQFLFAKYKANDVQVPSGLHACFLRFVSSISDNSVLKTPSVTLKKRTGKKKKDDKVLQKQGFYNVVACNTAKEYNLEKLVLGLQQHDVFATADLANDIGDSDDVLYATSKYHVEEEPREIFFFRDGSVVLWNIPKVEILDMLKFLKKYESGSIDEAIVQSETEHMNYRYCAENSNTSIEGDVIVFGPEDISIKLQKFTISNAMALSVNLGTWEATLDQYIESMEAVTEDLKFGKIIKMKQDEVLRKSGQLFALRHVINLSSDLLDTPDFYWDRDDLEKLYQKVYTYFCINRRTRVMNEKINHCLELVNLLSSHLSDKHHVRLEWMIIVLIMVEVAFEMLHYVHMYLENNDNNESLSGVKAVT